VAWARKDELTPGSFNVWDEMSAVDVEEAIFNNALKIGNISDED